jgi:putative transposase
MRRNTMTKPTMALAELAEKGADADLLREMIQFVAQRMMEMDVEGLCAAGYGERSPERANSRNGRRPRAPELPQGASAADSFDQPPGAAQCRG